MDDSPDAVPGPPASLRRARPSPRPRSAPVAGRTPPGRGAASNRDSRFSALTREPLADDGCDPAGDDAAPRHPATVVHRDASRTIIARNDSPDVPFTQSINAYRGCEHGCIYCFARPSHAYLDHSPGLDFETQLYAKPDAARLLDQELRRPGYRVSPIALGTNTDPYQPVEREYGLTRAILAKLLEFRHPVTIVTKSALVLRDLDLLQELAAARLAAVFVSVTTLDAALKRSLEPRASSGAARLRALAALAAAGVPTGVMVAPVIPAVTDHELEAILAAAAEAGARRAAYIPLRLPREVAGLFEEWLAEHLPLRAAHVRSLVRGMRGGRDNDPRFGHRMRGSGAYAEALRVRFQAACRRYGYVAGREEIALDTTAFRVPPAGGQLSLL
jgi:DNA repair photolyase